MEDYKFERRNCTSRTRFLKKIFQTKVAQIAHDFKLGVELRGHFKVNSSRNISVVTLEGHLKVKHCKVT